MCIRDSSVGDKMAGRHGNKGVVSRVLPVEDMQMCIRDSFRAFLRRFLRTHGEEINILKNP